MENKMVTPLGNIFSTNEKMVSQCDNQTLGSTTEILVIHFDQEKFEQLLSEGDTRPLKVRKHRKIFLARTLLAKDWKPVSIETSTTPTSFGREAMMSGVALNRATAKAWLSSEVKAKAPLGASAAQALSEANSASLKADALLNSARLASNNRAKAISAMPASPCEAKSCCEAISPMTKKKASKTKPKAFQSKKANFHSPRVSMLDQLDPLNTDLRDNLSNKQKLCS